MSFPDELSEREALIMCNRNRPKTREQQLKEYQELKVVAEERARLRQSLAGGDKKSAEVGSLRENFPQAIEETGKAADIAAAKIGLSGKTAEKGAEILEAVEILKEEGKAEVAPPVSTPPPLSMPPIPSENQSLRSRPRGVNAIRFPFVCVLFFRNFAKTKKTLTVTAISCRILN